MPAPGFPPMMPAPGCQPPLMRVPGPAALGPTPEAGYGAPGGVPGVSLAPVAGIIPPAATGGPHPLPGLPPMPLPQGFPNPFAAGQAGAFGPAGGGMPAPGLPGTAPGVPGAQGAGPSYVTGPQGYLPGLGYFGTPPAGAQPGCAGMQQPMPQFQQPFPGMQQPLPQFPQPMPPGMCPPTGGGPQGMQQPFPGMQQPMPGQPGQGGVNPFWLHMAWQLIQTTAVKDALGAQFQSLLEGANRNRLLQLAATTLVGQEMQTAFRNLSSRALTQQRFTELFATALKTALQSAGLLTV